MNFVQQLNIIRAFMFRELVFIRKDLPSMSVNTIIWPVLATIIYGRVMPGMGIQENYGAFMAVGIVVATWIFCTYECALNLAYDLTSNKKIEYELTLPIRSELIIIKYGLAFALHTFVFSFPLIFASKIFLGSLFDFTHFSFAKYLFINILGNLVFSFFGIWLGAVMSHTSFVHARVRVIDPLFFLGSYMSSWFAMEQALPMFSRFMLLNPMTHAMEAARVSVLGQKGLLPFWMSVSYLMLHLGLWVYFAIRQMRKRLDYVRA